MKYVFAGLRDVSILFDRAVSRKGPPASPLPTPALT